MVNFEKIVLPDPDNFRDVDENLEDVIKEDIVINDFISPFSSFKKGVEEVVFDEYSQLDYGDESIKTVFSENFSGDKFFDNEILVEDNDLITNNVFNDDEVENNLVVDEVIVKGFNKFKSFDPSSNVSVVDNLDSVVEDGSNESIVTNKVNIEDEDFSEYFSKNDFSSVNLEDVSNEPEVSSVSGFSGSDDVIVLEDGSVDGFVVSDRDFLVDSDVVDDGEAFVNWEYPIVDSLPVRVELDDVVKDKISELSSKRRAESDERKSKLAAAHLDSVVEFGEDFVLDRKRPKLDSGFVDRVSDEIVVGEDGRPIVKDFGIDVNNDEVVSVDNVSSPVNWSGGVPVRERERYTWVRGDGSLNGKELEFFRNMELSRAEFQRLGDGAVSLRPPIGVVETEKERKERLKRVSRAVGGLDSLKRGSKFRFVEKDREVLEFLAMFRYATAGQLGRMFSHKESTMGKRLKKLRLQGLVIDRKLYGSKPIWFLTSAGMIVSGFELPRITESKLTFSMFPHQFVVNNTAANLWGANVNVLNLPEYPSKNRVNDKGESVFGEELVSELELQSSLGKFKTFGKSSVYRPEIVSTIDRSFREWEEAGGVNFGPSPEMVFGNEYMWILFPPYNHRLAWHVPDLIVKRPRGPGGEPRSIAVEIELANKSEESYLRTLKAYKDNTRLFERVIWVCKSKGAASKLERSARECGLLEEGRIDIVPIITEDGIFGGRDLWTI